ncbi:hypothetical protein VQL36_18470 [Chengkuizengella sp. SCS-71B]|uniref:hypothetical protein n=1 Tax=Chengkuizengella sp. SCS-71B TaxID=3115290 RepID=UPI0032C23944
MQETEKILNQINELEEKMNKFAKMQEHLQRQLQLEIQTQTDKTDIIIRNGSATVFGGT